MQTTTIIEPEVSGMTTSEEMTIKEPQTKVELPKTNRRQRRLIQKINSKTKMIKEKASLRLSRNYALLQELRDETLKSDKLSVEQVNEVFQLTLKSLFKNDFKHEHEVIARFDKAKRAIKQNLIPSRKEIEKEIDK